MRKLLLIAIVFLPWLPGNARADAPAHDRFSEGEINFRRARELLSREAVDAQVGDDEQWRAATAGLLGASGRKWDKLLSPTEMAELHGDLTGEVVGIGVEIKFEPETGAALVLGAVPGSPAEAAGVVTGDRILRVDGKSYKGHDLRDVVRAMRGKAGAAVELTLLRDDKIVTKSVVRAPLAWTPVGEAVLPNDVALISVKAFNAKTPSLLAAALAHVNARGARGLVIDLRNDEGGLFQEMLTCAAQLLPRGSLVVTQIGRYGKEEALRTEAAPLIANVPVAVLVNNSTASGAEILAGALKANGARVVGKRTFGKWNVQKIADLGNGWAMKYTIGTFRAPSGDLLDGRGLDPDLEVEMDATTLPQVQRISDGNARLAADPQLRAAVQVLKLTR